VDKTADGRRTKPDKKRRTGQNDGSRTPPPHGTVAIFPVAPHSKLAPENSLTAYDVAAGATLLSEDQIKSIRQSASLMRPNFYGAALKLFQERHNLPFTDLMHSHILDPLKQQLSPEGTARR
jgi:hypothetical protein